MNYLDHKKLEGQVLESGNLDAMCYFMQNYSGSDGIIQRKIDSFKYIHADLNEEEMIELLRINNLNDDDVLIGEVVHRLVGDIQKKEVMLTKVDEIDLFTILHQINWIKTKGYTKI